MYTYSIKKSVKPTLMCHISQWQPLTISIIIHERTLSDTSLSHDNDAVAFQEKCGTHRRKPNVSEENVLHSQNTFQEELDCQKPQNFIKPADHMYLMITIQ